MSRAAALVLAGAVGASGAALAEKADRDMPTQIEANKMSADDARRMTIFEGSVVLTRGTMRLTADRGVLAREGDEIFLYDNVLLVREPDAQHPGTRMTTSFLHIVRDRSIIRTDREVMVVEGRRSLSGRGMEYTNDSRELVLHSDVRARFEPEKR